MIDYLTLMLINVAAGLVILALYIVRGLELEKTAHWAPAFAVTGLVASVGGFMLTFTWPLPPPYNIPYGELSVLFGVLFLGTAWAVAKGWSLLPLTIYAFFAGLASIVIGLRFIHLSLSNSPVLTGIGFILTGLGGIFAGAAVWLKKQKSIRCFGAAVMLAAAGIWLLTGIMAYWLHLNVKG